MSIGGDRSGQAPGPDGPLTVGYVSPGWPLESFANGVVTSLVHVAEEMRRLGHDPLILPQRVVGAADDREAWAIGRGVPERPLAVKAYHRLLDRFSSWDVHSKHVCRRLAATARLLVARRGLQVLEMEEAFGWPALVRPAVPIPIVVRLHGPWFLNGPLQEIHDEGPAFQARVRIEREGIRAADAVTAPSLDVLARTREFYRLPLKGAVAIPNPTPRVPAEARWTPEGADPDLILFVGRFDRHKGGDLIIDAFAEVARRRPRAKLRFAGDDKGLVDDQGRRRQIEEFAREKLRDLADSGRFEWIGRQKPEALAGLRRGAGLVVCCSRYETFGYTAIEAMALGCPLIAAGAGATLELVEDGVNGLICRSGEAADIADKICNLLDDRDLAARLGRRAALDCESKYDPARHAEAMVEVYRRVLRGRRR